MPTYQVQAEPQMFLAFHSKENQSKHEFCLLECNHRM